MPGNKVRTANFVEGFIDIKEKEEFNIGFNEMNYEDQYKYLKLGSEVWANDSIFKFKVKNIDVENKKINFISYSTGKL